MDVVVQTATIRTDLLAAAATDPKPPTIPRRGLRHSRSSRLNAYLGQLDRKIQLASKKELEHGKPSGYNQGCRCDSCREGYNARQRQTKQRARAKRATSTITHGASAYTYWGCRCEVCTTDHLEGLKPQDPDVMRVHARKKHARQQAETVEKATRHYYRWTGPELEAAAREDLTTQQVALLLGRTLKSVANMRRKLRDDPKTIKRAGIPRQGRPPGGGFTVPPPP